MPKGWSWLPRAVHCHRGAGPQTDRGAFDTALAALIDQYDPALVVLAGFMRILSPVCGARERLTNIHPRCCPPLPACTRTSAIDAGCKFAGATVHLVTAELDVGPILDQAVVPVLPGDAADTLAARVDARAPDPTRAPFAEFAI